MCCFCICCFDLLPITLYYVCVLDQIVHVCLYRGTPQIHHLLSSFRYISHPCRETRIICSLIFCFVWKKNTHFTYDESVPALIVANQTRQQKFLLILPFHENLNLETRSCFYSVAFYHKLILTISFFLIWKTFS